MSSLIFLLRCGRRSLKRLQPFGTGALVAIWSVFGKKRSLKRWRGSEILASPDRAGLLPRLERLQAVQLVVQMGFHLAQEIEGY
jgi:hypothetical protein